MKSCKRLIMSTFVGKYLVSILHCIECRIIPLLIDDEKAVKRFYYRSTGKKLNLNNPQTFSEKLNWYKLRVRDPQMPICADKNAVRKYVSDKGFADALNQIVGVFDKVEDIDIDELPDKFVLKATHGSHMNLIVKDKKEVNWKQQKKLLRTWLHQDISWSGREWVYKDIPKRFIVEEYLEDSSGGLRDYKIFCFNGIPRYIDVDLDRFTKHYRNFYTPEWSFIPMSSVVPNNPDIEVKPPERLEEMLEMARILSNPFQFVRVDFYEVNSKVVFSELTFFPDGGNPGYPDKYDLLIGNYWELENRHCKL